MAPAVQRFPRCERTARIGFLFSMRDDARVASEATVYIAWLNRWSLRDGEVN